MTLQQVPGLTLRERLAWGSTVTSTSTVKSVLAETSPPTPTDPTTY